MGLLASEPQLLHDFIGYENGFQIVGCQSEIKA
jgi:hypothetical protein